MARRTLHDNRTRRHVLVEADAAATIETRIASCRHDPFFDVIGRGFDAVSEYGVHREKKIVLRSIRILTLSTAASGPFRRRSHSSVRFYKRGRSGHDHPWNFRVLKTMTTPVVQRRGHLGQDQEEDQETHRVEASSPRESAVSYVLDACDGSD